MSTYSTDFVSVYFLYCSYIFVPKIPIFLYIWSPQLLDALIKPEDYIFHTTKILIKLSSYTYGHQTAAWYLCKCEPSIRTSSRAHSPLVTYVYGNPQQAYTSHKPCWNAISKQETASYINCKWQHCRQFRQLTDRNELCSKQLQNTKRTQQNARSHPRKTYSYFKYTLWYSKMLLIPIKIIRGCHKLQCPWMHPTRDRDYPKQKFHKMKYHCDYIESLPS